MTNPSLFATEVGGVTVLTGEEAPGSPDQEVCVDEQTRGANDSRALMGELDL